MSASPDIREQLAGFAGIAAGLMEMLRLAKEALNRQKTEGLDKLTQVQKAVVAEMSLHSGELDKELCEVRGDGQVLCLKMESVLTHLQLVARNIGEMVPPIRQQIAEGIPFSLKGTAQANQVFDGLAEILGDLETIFRSDNEELKQQVLKEKGPKVSQQTIDFATDHEARMIEGLCLPHAAPVFLGLLDAVRNATRHAMEVARLAQRHAPN